MVGGGVKGRQLRRGEPSRTGCRRARAACAACAPYDGVAAELGPAVLDLRAAVAHGAKQVTQLVHAVLHGGARHHPAAARAQRRHVARADRGLRHEAHAWHTGQQAIHRGVLALKTRWPCALWRTRAKQRFNTDPCLSAPNHARGESGAKLGRGRRGGEEGLRRGWSAGLVLDQRRLVAHHAVPAQGARQGSLAAPLSREERSGSVVGMLGSPARGGARREWEGGRNCGLEPVGIERAAGVGTSPASRMDLWAERR